MTTVFLIPGLGADHRIYRHIDVHGYNAAYVEWIEPTKGDTLTTYAQKLIDHYQIKPGSIVIGNSLGGMIAVEIAKKIDLNKAILISSIKTASEAPPSYKWFRLIPLYRILPAKLFNSLGGIVRFAFGRMSKTDQELFIDMLHQASHTFVKWAVGAVLHWKNDIIPPNAYHITGDDDHVFPHKYIKGAEIVHGGTHLMIFNRAKEINKWLKNILPL